MPIKKSELYSSLWESCDELRGGMDASQYKDYVLVLLFVKYVSDKYAGQKDALLDIPAGGRFADMVALKGDKEIGDKINKIIGKLADANNLKGVIDVADFNNEDKLGKGKEMVDRLSNLVSIFNNPALDFRTNRAEGDDILGDAYEYLMRHFATESGKSKGQFYTSAEQRERVLQRWYRQRLKELIPPLVEKWHSTLSVEVVRWGIKKMKTRWGTCNVEARRIWLNLELAKKPVQCLEYIVVHELVHLIERHHNEHFISIMDKHLPQWRLNRQELNAAPLAQEAWDH